MTRWAVGLAFALTCALVLTPQAEVRALVVCLRGPNTLQGLHPPAQAVLKYDLRRASLLAAAFAPAPVPAPAPAPASDDPAVELESIPAAGHIDPVSAPVLIALVPVAGEIRFTLNSSIQQVSSAVPSIVSAAKQTGHDIAAVFTGRKLLEVIAQVHTQQPLIAAYGRTCSEACPVCLLFASMCTCLSWHNAYGLNLHQTRRRWICLVYHRM